MKHQEQNYLELLSDVLYHGAVREDRTGVGTKSLWGAMLRFDLSKGFPVFTTRMIGPRIGIEEMLFFLRGDTQTKKLEEKNIFIWQGNTTRDFLDKRGLNILPEGDMGKGYGFQMRRFGGQTPPDIAFEENAPGFDQLKDLIKNLKENPLSRRHLMSYWNPQQLHEAALPPCHLLFNCQVVDGKLNGLFYMRSNDLVLGLPTNIVGYAFLIHLLAKLTGYEPGELVYMAGDAHIYLNHMNGVEELIKKEPKPFPTFKFKKEFSTLEEALALTYDDMEISNYQHCGKMKFDMAI